MIKMMINLCEAGEKKASGLKARKRIIGWVLLNGLVVTAKLGVAAIFCFRFAFVLMSQESGE